MDSTDNQQGGENDAAEAGGKQEGEKDAAAARGKQEGKEQKGKKGKGKSGKGGKDGKAGKGKKGKKGEKGDDGSATTELHTAAREGNLEKLGALLTDAEAMKAVNATDRHRRTALHLAAFFGKSEAVDTLLEKGADPHCEAMDGFLPLHFAAQSGHLEVLRLLVRKVGAKGERGLVKRYVNRVVPKGKKSALHLALQKGHSDCARFLVMKHASTELQTSQNQTALDLCQDVELRKELEGKASAAAKEEAAEENAEQNVSERAEPPAKKRAVGEPGAQEATVASHSERISHDAAPLQGLPVDPGKVLKDPPPGVLASGPWQLTQVEICADQTERSYPAGVPAMADVEWDIKIKDDPDAVDGPVWCMVAHEQQGKADLLLRLQRSSMRLLHYTHFSDDASTLDAESRCNACGLIILTETSDGLLLVEKQASGPQNLLPRAGVLALSHLEQAISKALTTCRPLASSIGSARLLGLLDVGQEANEGRRHELVVGVRLQMTSVEVQKSHAAATTEDVLSFLVPPGLDEPPEVASLSKVSLEEILSEGGGGLPEMQRRAVRLLRSLRG